MKLLVLAILFLCPIFCISQNKYVSGVVMDDEGEPLPGASVRVKNTTLTTYTDLSGSYTISYNNENDILEISYLGYNTQTIEVSTLLKNQQPAVEIKEPVPSKILLSTKDTIGVAFLSNETPCHNMIEIPAITHIKDFKIKGKNAEIKEMTYEYKGTSLLFSSTLGLENAIRLPELQHTYAQGQSSGGSLQWRGPETEKIFSWGPAINTLEYDGSNYDYDKNGRLVPLGSGNGNPANTYNAEDFFRTGVITQNLLEIKTTGLNNKVISFNLGQHGHTSPIPNSYKESYNTTLKIDPFWIRAVELVTDAMVSYNYSGGKLLNRGANLSTLMSSVFTTPPSFDNTNALSPSQAVKNKESYLLENGKMRSYSPLNSDNPYALVNELPDKESRHHLLASMNIGYSNKDYQSKHFRYEEFQINGKFTFEKQWDNYTNGTAASSSINPLHKRLLNHKENLMNIGTNLSSSYTLGFDSYKRVIFNMDYRLNYQEDYVYRCNKYETLSLQKPETNLDRITNELAYGITFHNDFKSRLEVGNRHYFSNTGNHENYSNWFPYVGFNVESNDFFDNDNRVSVVGSATRSMQEASLVYRNPAVLSTHMKIYDFSNYYESVDIFQPSQLDPEIYIKSEAGLKLFFEKLHLNIQASYFYNQTDNFIAPILTHSVIGSTSISEDIPELNNLGKVRSNGINFSASYGSKNYFHTDEFYWGISVLASHSKTKVTGFSRQEEYIPLAGFTDIATVFAPDKPLGAIYGTSYLRNENGEKIIDDDGFPMVDKTMKMIGDPAPDFTVSINPTFRWKKFDLSFVMEYRHGGDVWNGTQAVLDFYGISRETGDLRNTSGVVFKGVTTSGYPNSKFIDFYNPALPVYENRWVRYGFSGIGEEYIEDASCLRLSEAKLSYQLIKEDKDINKKRRSSRGADWSIKDLTFTFTGKNLFMFTPNTNVDPATNLFGYYTGSGLDLFNLPTTRSYLLSVIIGF